MNQPKQESGGERATNAESLGARYDELLDSLVNDPKNAAIEKHPELRAAYKSLEVYEHYFLAGGDWDEVGAVEFKKKMAEKIIKELVDKE